MIRLLVADDHPVVREGLRRIVDETPGMRVVAEARHGEEVLEQVGTVPADVLLLDVAMPGPGFLSVLEAVRAREPTVRVLVLSVHPEDQYAVRALRAGAAGYLTKDHSPEALVEAIRKVALGGTYVSAALAERLARGLRSDSGVPPHEALSDREYEVLCFLGSGRTVKDIAATLGLSVKTVSTYRSRLLQKMGFEANSDLVRYVATHGLLR
jgi:two-component system, NarL family, invasion response regulator UvrY